MDIKKLLKNEDISAVITGLKKGRATAEPDINKFLSQIDPEKHDINDEVKRPDKKVKVGKPESDEDKVKNVTKGGEKEENVRYEKVARIALAIQKLIVKRAVAFTFGNPVTLNAEPENEQEKTVLKAVKKALFNTKSRTINRKVAREIYSTTEAAELWYPVEKENENYGFPSKYKLRVAVFSPANGDKLYPYFDETGDLVAFSREFFREIDKVKITYFETYTDTEHRLWMLKDSKWELVEGYPKQITIGKIPIIYGSQPAVEWEDVQNLIDRLEKLLSNFADTNDYHGSPKIIVKGKLMGFSKKGESGAILEMEKGEDDIEPDAKYLSWEHAPASVKLEIETLLRMIYTITQTPDISFDSVKGIGAVSGIALKLLFMDAHLKVQDKMEIFDDYLQRRLSIIQAYLAQFNTGLKTACESLVIEPEIVPYMIEDEKAKVDLLKAANGDKAIASQKTTIQMLGWANDPDAEFEQILNEESADAYRDETEPTV
jgi:SPP1 family phage portal protein